MSALFLRREFDETNPGEVAICCPQCEYSLTLHQPDPELPERLLATCDDCNRGFSPILGASHSFRFPTA